MVTKWLSMLEEPTQYDFLLFQSNDCPNLSLLIGKFQMSIVKCTLIEPTPHRTLGNSFNFFMYFNLMSLCLFFSQQSN